MADVTRMNNPFKQPESIWLLSFKLKYKNINNFEEAFEEKTIAITSTEFTSQTIEAMDDDIWIMELYFDHFITKAIIPEIMLDLIDISSITIEEVQNKDWVAEAASSLVDIKTAKFHIVREEALSDNELLPVIINITRAFGTGEHATTMGCIEAMEISELNPENILDIGTGTGILAICAKKLWPMASVIGTDIDPIALEVAGNHAKLNNVDIKFTDSSNLKTKFDIILANILARPLIEMAENIASMLSPQGIVILSGFLDNQLESILSEYAKYGLSSQSVINKNRWIILVLA